MEKDAEQLLTGTWRICPSQGFSANYSTSLVHRLDDAGPGWGLKLIVSSFLYTELMSQLQVKQLLLLFSKTVSSAINLISQEKRI
jgi:hypothetical protein